MSFWTAVVVLTAIGCVTWLRAQKYRALGDNPDLPGQRRLRGNANLHSAREQELEQEVRKLQDRIAVLERIATDDRRGKDLANQIESLRD